MAVLKDLIVHGPSRFINGINANSIKADEGIFNQLIAVDLKATDATIDNLTATNARVTQTLTANHISTNTWEAANIANVGGNFYISPTGEQSGSINVTIARTVVPGTDGGTYTLTFGVPSGSSGGFGVSSTSAAYWSASAKVMATGEVSYNNSKRYPLGTCSGTISSVTASNNNITAITIAGVKSEALDVLFTDMGIAITASNGTLSGCVGYKLKISLYERYSSTSGAYYPIGILLTSLGRNDKKQYIDIYGGSIKSGRNAADNANLDTGMAEPTLRIGELEGLPNIVDNGTSETKPTGWGIYTTNGFFKGKIVSNAGRIANWTITDSSIQTGNYNTSGTMYFGSSGISLGTTFRVTSAGVLTATSGTIGGYSLTANYLQSTDGTTGISVADNSTTASWAFWAGGTTTSTAKFRVDHNGVLYATGADISGAITSTNGFYVKTSSTGDYIAQMTGSGISLGNAGTNGSTYTTYNIQIDPNTSTGGILLRKGTQILNKIDSSGMTIYDGTASNDANIVANFGKTISLGRTSGSRINLNTNQFIFYDKNDSPYFELNQGAEVTTTILKTTTLQIAINQTDLYGSTEYTLNSNELTAYNNNTLRVTLSGYSRRLGEASYAFETTSETVKIRVDFYANEYVNGVSVTLKTSQITGESKASLSFGSREGEKGSYSIVMGLNCIASKSYTFAAGNSTKAEYENQFVIGKYNNNNSANVFEIGWGTSSTAKKNIFEVNTSGKVNIPSTGQYLVNSNKLIKVVTVTAKYTSNIAASGAVTISTTYTLPSPYTTVVGLRQVNTNHNNVLTINEFTVSGDGAVGNTVTCGCRVRNVSNSVCSGTSSDPITVNFEIGIAAV